MRAPARLVFSFVLLALKGNQLQPAYKSENSLSNRAIPFQFRVRALHLQLCIPRPCMQQAYGGSYAVGVRK
jgi:hypothetical protein